MRQEACIESHAGRDKMSTRKGTSVDVYQQQSTETIITQTDRASSDSSSFKIPADPVHRKHQELLLTLHQSNRGPIRWPAEEEDLETIHVDQILVNE